MLKEWYETTEIYLNRENRLVYMCLSCEHVHYVCLIHWLSKLQNKSKIWQWNTSLINITFSVHSFYSACGASENAGNWTLGFNKGPLCVTMNMDINWYRYDGPKIISMWAVQVLPAGWTMLSDSVRKQSGFGELVATLLVQVKGWLGKLCFLRDSARFYIYPHIWLLMRFVFSLLR